MKLNFITRYFDAASSALGAAGPIGIGLSAAQTALGLVQSISADAKMKNLLAQRKAYVTPQEIYDILNATASRASSGYDPTTLSYLTNQTDRGLASSLNSAELLGADPNQLSDIFDKKIQASMEIGAQNQLLNMKNFENYLQAESVVAANKAAESKSQEDILKDKIQAAALNKQAGLANIGSGVNAGLAVASSYGTGNLYNPSTTPATPNVTSQLTPDYYIDVYKKLLENQNKRVG